MQKYLNFVTITMILDKKVKNLMGYSYEVNHYAATHPT